MSTPVPPGLRLALDESVRRFDGTRAGTVLLGGTPLRLLRLSVAGTRRLDAWLAGTPVGDTPADGKLARRLVDAGLLHPAAGPATIRPDVVTLVVPVKDNAAGLARVLSATSDMAAQVVVDDGSTDPIAEATVRHSHACGPAATRNSGWHHVRTGFVAFLDSDTIPEPGWLSALLPLFDDPEVAAVAPRVRSANAAGLLGRYEAGHSALDMGGRPGTVRPMSGLSYVPSAALVVRTRALHAVAGFDEGLRFGEDVDLVWRLIDRGYTVRYEPRAVTRHEPRRTMVSWLRQRFDYGTSAAPLAARHPGRLSPARVSRWSAAAWLLAASGKPLTGAALAGATASLLPRKLRGRGVPTTQALALAGRGHLSAGRVLAEATRRVWWPLALLTRRGRRVLLACTIAGLCDLPRRGEDLDAAALALRVGDDLAYGAGVWMGCIRRRTIGALLPTFTE